MKITEHLAIGFDSEDIGYVQTHLWTTGATYAEFVVIGFWRKKLPLTTSSPGRQITCFGLTIFNQPTAIVTIRKEVKDGNQR